jgi:hypothetical protein
VAKIYKQNFLKQVLVKVDFQNALYANESNDASGRILQNLKRKI